MLDRVVVFQAIFAAVLGTCLLLGAAFGSFDGQDFPGNAPAGVTAAIGFALMVFAWALLEAVSRQRVTERLVRKLAVWNACAGVVLVIWGLTATGFSTVGHLAVWVSAGALLLLTLVQAGARGTR
jgi:drug/metabolite transporter (DMT)-like permease